MSGPSHDTIAVRLTRRQADALQALARLDELPADIYAAEVLTKHIYHAYTPQVAQRAAELERTGSGGDDAETGSTP